jgi:hypothetical protein
MPPDPRSSEPASYISLFNMETLDFPDGLEKTLRSIESLCFQADPAIAGIVSTLNSRSHILEYIFSGVLRLPAAEHGFARRI